MEASADFDVAVQGNVMTFKAVSDGASSWLVSSGRIVADAPRPFVVRREGPEASVFLEALTRKGFKCLDASGKEVSHVVTPPANGTTAKFGCAAGTAMILAIPLAGIVYLVDWVFGAALAAAIGAAGLIVIISAVAYGVAQENRSEKDRSDLSKTGFKADAFDSIGFGEFIAIDKSNAKLAIKVKGSMHLRRFTDIVAVEFEQDGSSVEKTNRGSQIDGALTGALLAGPAGMMIGGLSGSKRIEHKVHAVTVNVFTRDMHVPTIKVPFLNNPAGAAISSGEYQRARKLAQDWYGRVKAIM